MSVKIVPMCEKPSEAEKMAFMARVALNRRQIPTDPRRLAAATPDGLMCLEKPWQQLTA